MATRKEFKMTEEQFQRILDASKPVPYLVFGGREPSSPQENANRAWEALADELGFEFMTVASSSKGKRFFTAETK